MKNKVWLFTAALLLFTAGCGKSDLTENENTESQENGESYTWEDVTLQFPKSWKDKYVVAEDENGFTVFQKASYEKKKGWDTFLAFRRTRNGIRMLQV